MTAFDGEAHDAGALIGVPLLDEADERHDQRLFGLEPEHHFLRGGELSLPLIDAGDAGKYVGARGQACLHGASSQAASLLHVTSRDVHGEHTRRVHAVQPAFSSGRSVEPSGRRAKRAGSLPWTGS